MYLADTNWTTSAEENSNIYSEKLGKYECYSRLWSMKSRWQSRHLKQLKIMRVYLDQSHRNLGNHKTVLNMSVKTVLTHFFYFIFLNIYLSKLQFSPGNLFEKLRKKFGNILSLDEIGKILLNVSTLWYWKCCISCSIFENLPKLCV